MSYCHEHERKIKIMAKVFAIESYIASVYFTCVLFAIRAFRMLIISQAIDFQEEEEDEEENNNNKNNNKK
jgi:uncharacterized protein YutD